MTEATARPSAAVLLVREAVSGLEQPGAGARDPLGHLEVLMVRRGASAAAFGGAWVFPGGVVQASDRRPAESNFGPNEALDELTRRGGAPPADGDEALAIWRAALRELFEEAGVLLVFSGSRHPLEQGGDLPAISPRSLPLEDPESPRVVELRRALRDEELSLVELLAADGLCANYRALTYFSHWITPRGLPRRFDTRFFAAAMPPGQSAAHCGVETDQSRWVEPHQALREYHEGRFPLVLPTRMHLQRIAPFRSVAALLAEAAAKPIATVLPDTPRPSPESELRW